MRPAWFGALAVALCVAGASCGPKTGPTKGDRKGTSAAEQDVGKAIEALGDVYTCLLDTGAAAGELGPEAIAKKAGWALVPEDTTKHEFAGEAVVLSKRLALVFRKKAPGAEVYALGERGPVLRATIAPEPASPDRTARLSGVEVVTNTLGAVELAARFETEQGKTLSALYAVTAADPYLVQVKAGAGAATVSASMKAAGAVVQDYFSDDVVYLDVKDARVLLPAENFFLNLVEGGDAMVMCVWESREQWAELVCKPGGEAAVSGTQVGCVGDKKVWFGFLEARGLWSVRSAAAAGAKTPTAVDWKPPFPARWRAGLWGEGETTSLNVTEKPEPDGSGGSCCVDGRGVVLECETERPERTLVLYPIDRTAKTPMNLVLPVDVMRNTLGVGPCQYVLALEGGGATESPTPGDVMKWVEKQFELKEAERAKGDIEQRLGKMVEHVKRTRERIEKYREFARGLADECRAARPRSEDREVERLAVKLVRIAENLEGYARGRLDAAKTPERAADLAAKVADLTSKPDAYAESRKLGDELRAIGEAEDAVISKCRMAVRRVRAECRTADAKAGAFAQEVGQRAERLLQVK